MRHPLTKARFALQIRASRSSSPSSETMARSGILFAIIMSLLAVFVVVQVLADTAVTLDDLVVDARPPPPHSAAR